MKSSDTDILPIWARPERPAHAQHPTLNRTQIIRAAIELADVEGGQAFSMRRLAAKLGVGTMSLYWYLSSKQDLIDLVLDVVYGEIDLPSQPSDDWRANLRLIAHQMRAMLRRHPWLSTLLNSRPPLGPNGLRYAEFCLATLDKLHLDGPTMISIFETLDGYVLGYVQTKLAEESARRHTGLSEQAWRQMLEPYVQHIIAAGRHPTFAHLFMQERTLNDEETGFEFGLTCLLDGIAVHLNSRYPGKHHPGRESSSNS